MQQTLAEHNNVVKIDLYTPIADRENIIAVINLIQHNQVEALTFSSSSAVRYYFSEAFPKHFKNYYAIGQQTANSIRAYGYEPYIADKQTSEALINTFLESRNK